MPQSGLPLPSPPSPSFPHRRNLDALGRCHRDGAPPLLSAGMAVTFYGSVVLGYSERCSVELPEIMPLIKVQTSISSPDKAQVESMLQDLSSALASHLGKPESYVMTAFEGDVPMTFGGTTEPVCYIEIKSVGTMGSKTKAMSQDFCEKVEAALGVPKNRTYIEFADSPGAMWGWNGGTFG